jgi:hypothetical protein
MSEKPGTNANASIGAAPGLRGTSQASDPALEYVRQALAGLQFGQVSIIVQDGVVVQVERTERRRFRRGENRIERP